MADTFGSGKSYDGTVSEEASGLGNRISGDVKEAYGAVTGDRTTEMAGSQQANMGAARQSNNKMLTGLFRDRDSAENAYKSLESRGYSRDDVNVLMSDKTRDSWFSDGSDTGLGSKALEGAGTGSAIGGTVGAVLAAIAAIGTSIVLPGIGLIVAGPLAAALAGAGAGGLTGGLIGALVGSGIPEDRAREYESGIKNGGMVMGVTPRSDEDADYFENEFRTHRAESVYR